LAAVLGEEFGVVLIGKWKWFIRSGKILRATIRKLANGEVPVILSTNEDVRVTRSGGYCGVG
jgi:hypothetical protein